MKAIETTLSVSDNGTIHISPLADLTVGNYKAILIVEEIKQVSQSSERERVKAALKSAGLLAEPTQEMRKLAEESTLTLDEMRAILNGTEGRPLSEVILEMRGSKK